MQHIQFFHIGPQKSSTTWQYHCFKEHPDITVAQKDSVHYFDMFFHRGEDWFHNQFTTQNRSVAIDMTPSYIRDFQAPQRIYDYNPQGKIILCLREPISRAFSHYWHNKKKSDFHFSFAQVFKNYDLFSSWIQTGFYAVHIERYLQFFKRENIHVQIFDELAENPKSFIQSTYRFMGVDDEFVPETVNHKVNEAKKRKSRIRQNVDNRLRRLRMHRAITLMDRYKTGKVETVSDIPQDIYDNLRLVYEPEITRLENLLDIDLSSWRQMGR